MKKKSICFLIPGYVTKHTGGAELQIYFLSEELLKRGWEIEIVTSQNKKNDYHLSPYFNSQVKYHYYKTWPLLSIGLFGIFFTLLKTKSTYYYNRTNARLLRKTCLIYCKIFNKKMIYAIAGDDETKLNTYYSQIKIKRFNILNYIKRIDAFIIDKFIGKSALQADLVLCQTFTQKNKLLQEFGIRAEVIRNSYIIEKKYEKAQKENIILWVGNLRAVKRPEIFLKLLDDVVLEDWQYVMIGNVGSYANRLKRINNNHVTILGELSYAETINWFKKAKILINTSSSEGYPNTFIQAWLYKVIVLSLKVDPDYIFKKGRLGFIAGDDYEKLKSLLVELTNSYKNNLEFLEKAKRFAEKEFNIDENVNKLELLLKNC